MGTREMKGAETIFKNEELRCRTCNGPLNGEAAYLCQYCETDHTPAYLKPNQTEHFLQVLPETAVTPEKRPKWEWVLYALELSGLLIAAGGIIAVILLVFALFN